MSKIWAVWRKANPHRWSPVGGDLVVAYDNQDDAENFVAIHPQYHFRHGYDDPATILEVEEIELGHITRYWNPSFP